MIIIFYYIIKLLIFLFLSTIWAISIFIYNFYSYILLFQGKIIYFFSLVKNNTELSLVILTLGLVLATLGIILVSYFSMMEMKKQRALQEKIFLLNMVDNYKHILFNLECYESEEKKQAIIDETIASTKIEIENIYQELQKKKYI